MDLDIVVVGSCNIDQIAYAPRLPSAGETIHGTKYEVGFGGKGANQCVGAAKLGAKTAMVAKLGDDDSGKSFISHMQSLGVNTKHMTVTDKACTGVAPITVAANGSNNIVIVSGANMLLDHRDVDNALSEFKGAKMLLCQLEVELETTLHALKAAKSAGMMTLLNPAPAATLTKEFYKYADIMCPNETEASLLTGIEVTDIESAKKAAEKMRSNGTNTCIITLGKDGCVFADQSTPSPEHVPGRVVTAFDTAGAGDAFIGALAYFLCYCKGVSMKNALSRACWVAAESVQHKGTQKSFPTRSNLPSELFKDS